MGRFSFEFPLGRVEISYSFGEGEASVRGNGLICGDWSLRESVLTVSTFGDDLRLMIMPGFWARPAVMAMEVCIQRRNGDECSITLCLLRLSFTSGLPPECSMPYCGISSVSRLRKIFAMRAPRALD
jgi:hypothetical protein